MTDSSIPNNTNTNLGISNRVWLKWTTCFTIRRQTDKGLKFKANQQNMRSLTSKIGEVGSISLNTVPSSYSQNGIICGNENLVAPPLSTF